MSSGVEWRGGGALLQASMREGDLDMKDDEKTELKR